MPTEPQVWVAWRRPVDSRDAWTLLPTTEASSRVEAYNRAMDLELAAGDMGFEYQIMLKGMAPERDSYGDRGHYRTRELRRR